MFAYCNNNPVNNVDPTGMVAEGVLIAGAAGLAALEKAVALICVAAAVIGTVIYIGPTLADYLDIAISNAKAEAKSKAKEKDKTITIPKPRKDPVHHIVAQTDPRARPAQDVLSAVGIDRYTDPANQVQLPAYYHYRIHSTAYYEYVNEAIVTAYQAGGKESVYDALTVLKWEIAFGALW